MRHSFRHDATIKRLGWAVFLGVLLMPVFGFADDPVECRTGPGWGAPFLETDECRPGRHTEPLDCCQATLPLDDNVECAGDRCVELLESYSTCGGPISSFLVDSESNVYFWSGRWNLHSLDQEGNLRWRFDLCGPEGDVLCSRDDDLCHTEESAIIPTVLDYHDRLYFFIGETLYAMSSDGEVLEKRRVEFPDLELPEHADFYIGNGIRQDRGGIASDLAGGATLTTRGEIVSPYTTATWEWEGFINSTGTVTVSRRGEYLDAFDSGWKEEPYVDYGFRTHATLLDEGRHLYTGAMADMPADRLGPERTGFIGHIKNQSLTWSEEVERDYPVHRSSGTSTRGNGIASQPAVGPDGRVYALARQGGVYALAPESRELRRLVNFQSMSAFAWYTRPVVGADGTVYFIQNHQLSGSTLWAIDPDVLWDNPLDGEDISDSSDPSGVKWTYTRGPHGGGLATPAIAEDGTVYAPMNGLSALDPDTGEELWRLGELTMGSSPTILPDGTIVVGQSSTGQVFFLRENVDNGGLATDGWPQAHRDHYHSNNAAHPFVWDRSEEPPYPADPFEPEQTESGCQIAPSGRAALGGMGWLVLVVMLGCRQRGARDR